MSLGTIVSVGRSFLILKCLKSYLRNSTGENRLHELARLGVHRKIPIKNGEVMEICFVLINFHVLKSYRNHIFTFTPYGRVRLISGSIRHVD